MIPSFRIDCAFRRALAEWRAFLAELASEPTGLRLSGGPRRLLPDRLVVEVTDTLHELQIDWPTELPQTCDDLRDDERVWHLFLAEWSREEIRDYLDLPPGVSETALQAAFVHSAWWAEFETMVLSAFRYEWRSSLDALAPATDHLIRCSIDIPDVDDMGLEGFESRLQEAARGFEATHLDAQLLYGENARIVGFLHLAADV